ncbi:hypothetical protein VTO73DRAFT_13790 [Trametes versicolor]
MELGTDVPRACGWPCMVRGPHSSFVHLHPTTSHLAAWWIVESGVDCLVPSRNKLHLFLAPRFVGNSLHRDYIHTHTTGRHIHHLLYPVCDDRYRHTIKPSCTAVRAFKRQFSLFFGAICRPALLASITTTLLFLFSPTMHRPPVVITNILSNSFGLVEAAIGADYQRCRVSASVLAAPFHSPRGAFPGPSETRL